MPHDSARLEDTRAWLTKARLDLEAGEFDLTATPPFSAASVFHAQQAVEKALKGYLAWHDEPFRKTHNLTELGEQVARLDPSLGTLLARASQLTEYAWRYRYPGEPMEPDREEAQKALGLARDVWREILGLLPEEAQPGERA